MLDFGSVESLHSDVELPRSFQTVKSKQMMYAAGDGIRYSNNSRIVSDIERLSPLGFNIFVCLSMKERGNSVDSNLQFLKENPSLNVVLCLITGNKYMDYPILERLFPGTIQRISTDDIRFYPSSELAFHMLVNNGVCEQVHIPFVVTGKIYHGVALTEDWGWGEPNFRELPNEGQYWTSTFIKTGTVFNPLAKYFDTRKHNVSKDERSAFDLAGRNYQELRRRQKLYNDRKLGVFPTRDTSKNKEGKKRKSRKQTKGKN